MKIIKAILLYCLSVACATFAHAQAPTNGLDAISSSIQNIISHLHQTRYDDFGEIVLANSVTNFDLGVRRRLVPFSHGDIHDSTTEFANRSLEGTSTRALERGARQYAEDYIELWNWPNEFLGRFFSGSVGGVYEEELTLDPSYQPAKEPFLAWLRDGKNFRPGLRPFSRRPYAFISAKVRRHGDYLGALNFRLYYADDYYTDYTHPKSELLASIPIFDGVSLVAGTSFTYDIGNGDKLLSESIRIEGVFYGDKNKVQSCGYWYVGGQTSRQQVNLGVSFMF